MDAGETPLLDARPADSDGGLEACLASMPLANGRNRAIVGAQAVDLDGDGVDEVLLFTDVPRAGPTTLVSSRACATSDAGWVYQDVWQPTVGEPLRVHQVARAVDGDNEARLVAMAEGTTANWLAAFAFEDDRPVDDAAFFEVMPQSAGATCSDAEPPFAIIAGSFDDEPTTGPGDLVFAQSKQSWRYLVNSWNSPQPWDSQCIGDAISGDIPDRISGPGTRLAIAKLPALPGGQDGHVELRDNIMSMCDAGTCRNQSWGATDVIGVATAAVGVDDGHIDFVGWHSANPMVMLTAKMSKLTGVPTVELSSFSIDGPAPNQVVLLSHGVDDFALLIFDTNMQLFKFAPSAANLQRDIPLDFASDITAAPNWGADGTRQILRFRADTGDVQCVEFANGELDTC